jgi:hypothetical protein
LKKPLAFAAALLLGVGTADACHHGRRGAHTASCGTSYTATVTTTSYNACAQCGGKRGPFHRFGHKKQSCAPTVVAITPPQVFTAMATTTVQYAPQVVQASSQVVVQQAPAGQVLVTPQAPSKTIPMAVPQTPSKTVPSAQERPPTAVPGPPY